MHQFPHKHNPLLITGPAGPLQASVAPPMSEAAPVVMIICHPHPLYGGTMDNKVVTTVARACYDLGIWSLRFNFRGVGQSAGQYSQGQGEIDDALALVAWVQRNFPGYSIWLAGFSFGGYVAMQTALRAEVSYLITVAPAVQYLDVDPAHFNITCPWLVLMGEADELLSVEELKTWLTRVPVPVTSVYFPDVGHFFHNNLVPLREELKRVLSTALSASALRPSSRA